MPLTHSSSDKAFRSNLKAELAAGRPRDQALAVAYSIKRRGRAPGGMAPPSPPWYVRDEAKRMMHSGPINSAVPGRTDRHVVRVPVGSYVFPSSHVASLGQENSIAGLGVLGSMFGGKGPYGGPGAKIRPGKGIGTGRRFAEGGAPDDGGDTTEIVVAGGEYLAMPWDIQAALNEQDLTRAHEILDSWVVNRRKDQIKTLKTLDPPAKK